MPSIATADRVVVDLVQRHRSIAQQRVGPELVRAAGAGVGTTSMDPRNATCGYSCFTCPTLYPPCCGTTSKIVGGNMRCV